MFRPFYSGPNATYLGRGDKHDVKFDRFKLSSRLHDLQVVSSEYTSYSGVEMDGEYCPFTINIYPSREMQDMYTTKNPVLFTLGVLFLFMFVGLVFCVYDLSVEHRQKLVVDTALKTNAIVSSLFPSAIRDQLIEAEQKNKSMQSQKRNHRRKNMSITTLISKDAIDQSPQMAHLYPETTVIFADFAGFTAWSSSRNPNQVFMLLETIYGVFDKLAKSRKIFKVETIGDCYVAATGLPNADKKHAERMVIFAAECLDSVSKLVIDLITTLGPETADLDVRIGVNSGPTTAGVLRGDKARFQLFGDTVNLAARMENTGKAGRIHASQKTVNYLIAAGKEAWITERADSPISNDKGHDKTYWVHPTCPLSVSNGDTGVSARHNLGLSSPSGQGQMSRMVDWNVDVLLSLLKRVVAHRTLCARPAQSQAEVILPLDSDIPLVDMTESIRLPSFGIDDSKRIDRTTNIQISAQVTSQLRNLVTVLAGLYRENQFHNFEHACHVVMSTTKLISRISSLEASNVIHQKGSQNQIALDPITQFAIVFSALVHDVDHMGVSNSQLLQENTPTAHRYKGKCIAEQNSIEVAWNVLMQSTFSALRECIASTTEELKHFRKVLVHSVLATDIFDKDVKALGDLRWTRTFSNPEANKTLAQDKCMDRKAAIVIELVMQASDVCHTMQHWKIYQKWNEKLFNEMYVAFLTGKSQKDPAEGWYMGELWFFDNYVIPLAQKLKICGVFGVSCDEFLDYAKDNRVEWEVKGREITREFAEKAKLMWDYCKDSDESGMFTI
jgi:class 3 adenylate cyclase